MLTSRPRCPSTSAMRACRRDVPARLGSGRRRGSSEGGGGEIPTRGVPPSRRKREDDVASDISARQPLETGHGEDALLTESVEPAHQRDPAMDGGASHRASRARSGARLGCRPATGEHGQRDGDRAGAVPAPNHEASRADDEDNLAPAAAIATKHHQDLLGRPCRRRRTPHLPLHEPVSDDEQPLPERTRRRVAARARARTRLGTRRHLRKPVLDPESARDESVWASLLFDDGEARRRRGPAKETLLRLLISACSPSRLSTGTSARPPSRPVLALRLAAMPIDSLAQRSGAVEKGIEQQVRATPPGHQLPGAPTVNRHRR